MKRKIGVFSSVRAVCAEVIGRVEDRACSSWDVVVLDMQQSDIAELARSLGVFSVPAVVMDGALAECCVVRGPDDAALRAAGFGEPLA